MIRKNIYMALAGILFLLTAGIPAQAQVQTQDNAPEPLILDVDMDGDVDDIMALRLADNLDSSGKIKLLAVTSSAPGNESAVKGFLTYDGKGNVPFGYCEDDSYVSGAGYIGYITQSCTGTNPTDTAVRTMRRVLAESENMVSIMTTGFLVNIRDLMKSGPDDISDKTGMELIREKVKEFHVTGGAYPEGGDANFLVAPYSASSAQYVLNNWPSEVPCFIYTNDLGGNVILGGQLQAADSEKIDLLTWSLYDHGVTEGSYGWDVFNLWVFWQLGNVNDYNITYKKCDMFVYSDGTDTIIDNDDGRFYRLIKNESPEYYKAIIDPLLFPGVSIQ